MHRLVVASLWLIVLVPAGCAPKPEHDPAFWRAFGADVQAFHQALCPAAPRGGIPGGTLADGSCDE